MKNNCESLFLQHIFPICNCILLPGKLVGIIQCLHLFNLLKMESKVSKMSPRNTCKMRMSAIERTVSIAWFKLLNYQNFYIATLNLFLSERKKAFLH